MVRLVKLQKCSKWVRARLSPGIFVIFFLGTLYPCLLKLLSAVGIILGTERLRKAGKLPGVSRPSGSSEVHRAMLRRPLV
ncbi:Hypothetical predicted protein [Marmota monax]|uniref:Uncharacterized protein n=1 Tax=Marmota monax TaxID=9995 RepID=A0A5E4CXZ2_MARMO|nr:hypothetical protein GHT09_000473 [Marmota monax]VTJ86673.1 Hypothetical predicted protein [Marmota monax]